MKPPECVTRRRRLGLSAAQRVEQHSSEANTVRILRWRMAVLLVKVANGSSGGCDCMSRLDEMKGQEIIHTGAESLARPRPVPIREITMVFCNAWQRWFGYATVPSSNERRRQRKQRRRTLWPSVEIL